MIRTGILLFLFIPAVLIHGRARVSVRPGVDIYSDAMGYGVKAGIVNNFVPGFQTGIDLTFSSLLSDNLSFFTVGAGFNTGYNFTLPANLVLTPGVLFGMEFIRLAGSATNLNRFGILLDPFLNLEYIITENLSAGIEASYRTLVISYPVYLYGISSFRAALSLSWSFDPDRKPTDEQTLASDIRSIVKGRMTDASVGTGRNEVQMNLSDVLFETGSAQIGGNSVGLISEIAQKAALYPGMTVLIEGHTDNSGTREENAALSLNRARNVAAVFMKSGISESRIAVRGHGPDKPIAPNNNPQDRAKNRRVEVKFQFNNTNR